MTPELTWLTATALATALMWAPYVLAIIVQMGLVGALTQRVGDDPGKAGWAQRARHAHRNAVENLVVFAPLAIGIHITGTGTETTALVAMAFFWLRIAHYLVYVAGIPVVRTLIFAGGVLCQLYLGVVLLQAGPAG